MKSDFGRLLEKFFRVYLPNDIGASVQTISTYRYAFIQFLQYMRQQKKLEPQQICLEDISFSEFCSFLNWLETERKVSISTRNSRLAAFKSFAAFVRFENPEFISTAEKIRGIKPKRKEENAISYLTIEGIQLITEQPNRSTRTGIRDYAIIMTFVLTGIRVSELIEIRRRDISMSTPRYIVIHGKGGKIRHIPLINQLVNPLKDLIRMQKLDKPENFDNFVFTNHSSSKFTRQGINYLIIKYANMARDKNSSIIPRNLSPHKLRHSCAMALIEKGTELIVIRDLFGHSSITTTEIYARLSNHRKRQAIEIASQQITTSENAEWDNNTSLLEWLQNLGKCTFM